ncbi:TonB-dependent receptor, partial [Arthrospira platensis SPKY1]|nr:TonB-dependent receptor [Arthrospira platensis SPKY1]
QQLGSMQQITTGIDFRNGGVDGADVYVTSTDEVINQGKMNMLGAFVQDEISIPGTKFSVLAGLRFDHASFYDGRFLVNNPTSETEFLQDYDGDLSDANFNALSPRIGIQYFTNSKYRLFAGYSRGFRSPVLDDM